MAMDRLDPALTPVKNRKVYIGDAVYVDFNGYALVLTTEDGINASNCIVLEPEVRAELHDYVDRLRAEGVARGMTQWRQPRFNEEEETMSENLRSDVECECVAEIVEERDQSRERIRGLLRDLDRARLDVQHAETQRVLLMADVEILTTTIMFARAAGIRGDGLDAVLAILAPRKAGAE